MRRLHLAELRDSWTAWLGVSLAFVVTNATLALSALALLAGLAMIRSGRLDVLDSTAYAWNPAQNIVFCAVIGAAVIGSSTGLVVNGRRGSLARLALSGATPGQVVGTIMTQLAVVSVLCSLLGDAAAYALLTPTLAVIGAERGETMPVPDPVWAVWPVLLVNLAAVGLAMLGGLKQARRASRIPPVEALRQAAGTHDEPMTTGRWIGAAGCVLVIAGSYGAIPALTAERTKETLSTLVVTALGLLVVSAALVALVAPRVVGPLTRGWTGLVAPFDPSWELARATTVARAARLTMSVVPVSMAIGLLFGMVALTDTLLSSLRANGYDDQLSHVGPLSFLMFLGLPLLIALAGSVGSLVMTARQREADLALCGVIGATPAQRIAVPVLEALIITVTGAVLGLVMVAVSTGFLAAALPSARFRFAFSPSWETFAVALLAAAAVTVAATLLPTLPGLRRPEPRVIARLVAQ